MLWIPRPNPAWTNSALLHQWDDIQRVVGPALMPKVTKHTATKVKAVEYGSGVYGTVMPTYKRGVVVKVTSDPTEAFFAYLAATRLRKYPSGLVRYGRVFQLQGERQERPIFILWREEAYDVGDVTNRAADDALDEIRDQADKAFRLTYTPRLRASYLDDIQRSRKTFRRHTGYEHGGHPGAVRRIQLFIGSKTTEAGYGVEAARTLADRMSRSRSLPLVGGTIRDLIDQGILLADVHGGNVGRVVRAGRKVAVITDPGNVGLLTNRYDNIRVPVLPHHAARKVA